MPPPSMEHAPLPCPERQRATPFGDAGSGRFQDLTLGWQLDSGGRIISVGVRSYPQSATRTHTCVWSSLGGE